MSISPSTTAVVYASFRKAENDTTDEIVIVNKKGTFTEQTFIAPNPEIYPYIYLYNPRSGNSSLDFTIKVIEIIWREQDNAIAGVLRNDITANRPVGSSIYVGFMYMDATLGKPIYASVISGDTVTWVDATGATV